MFERLNRLLASWVMRPLSEPGAGAWLKKVNALDTAIDFSVANNIARDYLEFGVFESKSFIHACHCLTKRNVRAAGVHAENIVAVAGYDNESLTPAVREQHRLERAAIVHVDCDLYESTVEVLEFITPLVIDGTVFVFDDYFYYRGHPRRGERGAFQAWSERHPEFTCSELCRFMPAAAFIVNTSP